MAWSDQWPKPTVGISDQEFLRHQRSPRKGEAFCSRALLQLYRNFDRTSVALFRGFVLCGVRTTGNNQTNDPNTRPAMAGHGVWASKFYRTTALLAMTGSCWPSRVLAGHGWPSRAMARAFWAGQTNGPNPMASHGWARGLGQEVSETKRPDG